MWAYEGIAWYVAPVEMVEEGSTLSPKGAGNSAGAGSEGVYNLTTASAAEGDPSSPAAAQAEGTANTTSLQPQVSVGSLISPHGQRKKIYSNH